MFLPDGTTHAGRTPKRERRRRVTHVAMEMHPHSVIHCDYESAANVRRDDGSWVYPYFQENADPSQRDREATNRGLMKCMEEGIPVGVLMQAKPKPGVEYDVLGLARPCAAPRRHHPPLNPQTNRGA